MNWCSCSPVRTSHCLALLDSCCFLFVLELCECNIIQWCHMTMFLRNQECDIIKDRRYNQCWLFQLIRLSFKVHLQTWLVLCQLHPKEKKMWIFCSRWPSHGEHAQLFLTRQTLWLALLVKNRCRTWRTRRWANYFFGETKMLMKSSKPSPESANALLVQDNCMNDSTFTSSHSYVHVALNKKIQKKQKKNKIGWLIPLYMLERFIHFIRHR